MAAKFKEIGSTGVKVASLKASDLRIDMPKNSFSVTIRGMLRVQEGDNLDLDARYIVIEDDHERYFQGIANGQTEFACELI
jgi:hypothetical protein